MKQRGAGKRSSYTADQRERNQTGGKTQEALCGYVSAGTGRGRCLEKVGKKKHCELQRLSTNRGGDPDLMSPALMT